MDPIRSVSMAIATGTCTWPEVLRMVAPFRSTSSGREQAKMVHNSTRTIWNPDTNDFQWYTIPKTIKNLWFPMVFPWFLGFFPDTNPMKLASVEIHIHQHRNRHKNTGYCLCYPFQDSAAGGCSGLVPWSKPLGCWKLSWKIWQGPRGQAVWGFMSHCSLCLLSCLLLFTKIYQQWFLLAKFTICSSSPSSPHFLLEYPCRAPQNKSLPGADRNSLPHWATDVGCPCDLQIYAHGQRRLVG